MTSIDSANEKVTAKRRTKTNGVYEEINVDQPYAFYRYNQFMNAVDRSDQMLACHNVSRKCYRWWKTLFFHLIDIAVVNGYLLFSKYRRDNPDNPPLNRPRTYTIVEFREEIIRQICGIAEYERPPIYEAIQPLPPPDQFCTAHLVRTTEGVRRTCVVCYAAGRGQRRCMTFCSAPQCNKYMHAGGEFDCFSVWHSRDYPGRS